jgi:hypothetical protein
MMMTTKAQIVPPNVIPPPGDGQKIYEQDPHLLSYKDHLEYRYAQYKSVREHIDKLEGGLEAFSRGYEKFGFNRSAEGITYREWAPGAKVRVCSGFIQESCLREILPMAAYSSWFGFCLILVFCAECVTHGRLQQLESNCKYVGKE